MKPDAANLAVGGLTAADYRHNFLINVLDVSFFLFGMSVVSATVVLPEFARRLGASSTLIALIPAVQILGGRLPNVLVSFYAERRPLQKPWSMAMGIPQRIPWAVVGVAALLLAADRPQAMLAVLLGCVLAGHLAFGFNAPAWGELMAKAIPESARGRFWAVITMLSGILGVAGGLVVRFVMTPPAEGGWFAYPNNYAMLFFIASALVWVSYGFFAMNREPALPPTRAERSLKDYFGSLGRIVRTDRAYRRLMLVQILGHSSVIGMAFLTVHTMTRFDLPEKIMGNFVVVSTVTPLVAAPLLGYLGDHLPRRHGHKTNYLLSMLFYAGAAAVALTAPRWEVMYAAFALLAACIAAQMVSLLNLTYQFAPEGKRPTYLALIATASAPFVLAYSLAGGWLADHSGIGYDAPLLLSMVLSLLGAGLLALGVTVPDRPGRDRPVLDAIRQEENVLG